MKRTYAVRNGKVVEITDEVDSAPKNTIYIGNKTISKGMKWGVPNNRVDTRITRDRNGNTRLHKRMGVKKNHYISKK